MRYCLLLLIPLLLLGCESAEELVPAPVEHTPLAFDPTESYEIGQWWSNGSQMLRLDEAGSYALYGDQNRYHNPRQRGRWSQQSYAVLRLEPYDRLKREWIRVAVSRIDDEIALSVLDMEPMFAIPRPPLVAEDELLGTWSGETGLLSLGDDRRYGYSPAPMDIQEPAIIAGHEGTWRLDGDRLLLRPSPPNMGPFELWVIKDAEAQVLTGPDGEFRRTPDAAPGPPIS